MLYSRIHDTTPTRKSRTLKKARYVYGDGDAKNRDVRCQYCGFICDTKRDILQPTSGVSAFPSDITEGVIRDEDGAILMEEDTNLPLIIEQYSYTDFYYQYKPIETYTVTHNCPFCGGQYTL